jgi:hypothetical protein
MKLLKLIYRIIRNKKILLSVVIVLLLIMVIIPFLTFKLSAKSKAEFLNSNPIAVKLLPIYWKIRKTSDIFYLPYYFKKNPSPKYELIIDEKDQKELDDSLPSGFMNVIYYDHVYVPAKFVYGKETYDVEVRYRGDNAIHWNAPKKSYLIKFDKDKPFQGHRQLSFIIPRDRYFALEEFNNYRADKFGLYRPASWFGNLKINGNKSSLYFIIENWNKEMITKWEAPDESNFYGNTMSPNTTNYSVGGSLWSSLDSWKKLADDSQFNFGHYSELSKLEDLLNNSSDDDFSTRIFNIIDKDNIYSWQVMQELSNANHHILDSMRLYFDNSSGKFHFIPWDVGGGREGQANDHLELYGELAGRIFENSTFAHEKNKLLYDYASSDDNLKEDLKEYDDIYDSMKTALYKDRLKIYPNKFADSTHKEFRQKITQNFDRVKDSFGQSLVSIDSHVIGEPSDQNNLAYFDLNIVSRADLYFKNVEVKLIDGNLENYYIYYDLNNNNELDSEDTKLNGYKDVSLATTRKYNSITHKPDFETTQHRFFLVSSGIAAKDFQNKLKSFKFTLENRVTGKKIKDNDIKDKIINDYAFKYFDLIDDIEKFKSLNQIFFVSGNEIILSGTHSISETVIVPKGYSLKIMPGTTLYFAPGTSLISYSNIIAADSSFLAQNPDSPWGVFAIINASGKSTLSNVRFSDGSDAYVNGVYFSGMLSSYHSPIEISNSHFQNANADDALNAKSTEAKVVNSTFINNSADAIDFDFVKSGSITSCIFEGNGNDSIDLSGSTIEIVGNEIKNSGDKCISIGEKSIKTFIDNNLLSDCHIGLEVKDESEITIKNSTIKNNKIGINAYIKKPVFGPSLTEVHQTTFEGNDKDTEERDGCTINLD